MSTEPNLINVFKLHAYEAKIIAGFIKQLNTHDYQKALDKYFSYCRQFNLEPKIKADDRTFTISLVNQDKIALYDIKYNIKDIKETINSESDDT